MGALFASFRRERHVPKSWRWPVESHSDLRNLRASLIDVHDGIVRLLVGGKILHPQRLSEEHLFVKLDKRSMRVDHLCVGVLGKHRSSATLPGNHDGIGQQNPLATPLLRLR
jgi:hypothetical protein